ncbi:hypothetical protein SBBP2_230008 [Burkholderiales bacterium]|nr:hypothetical protein SBBP2_230008 [Burkholderiales bacterium]
MRFLVEAVLKCWSSIYRGLAQGSNNHRHRVFRAKGSAWPWQRAEGMERRRSRLSAHANPEAK